VTGVQNNINEYYPVKFIIKQKEYFCIWFSDDNDLFLLNDGRVLYFVSEEDMFKYSQEIGLQLKQDIVAYDIDFAKSWLDQKNIEIDCKYFLEFWNIVNDFAKSISKDFYGNKTSKSIEKLYDKLFYGNNLSAVNKYRKVFQPNFTISEISELKNVVFNGINIVREHLGD
jgi:hypothetical protein